MAGYTPLFSTLTTGTLCGKWPDIGLWPIVLSMADRHGVVDCTQAYIAGVTGLALEEVRACMARFCKPDPGSRSDEHNGARLVLIDDHRDWGWRVVNHGMYREKARKAAFDSQRTETGADAERKRAERAAHINVSRDVPTRPDVTRVVPPSDSDANKDSDSEKNPDRAAARPETGDESAELQSLKAVYPKRAGHHRWPEAQRAIRARISEGHTWFQILEGAHRYAAFIRATGKERTEFVMQAATFVGTGRAFLEPWDPPATKAEIAQDANIGVAQAWLRQGSA